MAERFFLFLEAESDNEGGHKWFCISDHNQSGETLSPVHGMTRAFPGGTLTTSIGHRVYVIGGSDSGNFLPSSSEAWYTGVYLSENGGFFGCGWQQAPNMIVARCNNTTSYRGSVTVFPHEFGIDSAIGVPHTIFVFRGTRNNQLPWAEYFDSSTQIWSALPPPQAEISRLNHSSEATFNSFTGPASVFDHAERRILFHTFCPKVLYGFDIRPQPDQLHRPFDFAVDPTNRWTLLNPDLVGNRVKMVLSGNCLYLLKEEPRYPRGKYIILGCNIGPALRGQYTDDVEFDYNLFPMNNLVPLKDMHFVSLDNNGRLCVLWALPEQDFGALTIRCVILTIQENANGPPRFSAQLDSDRVFSLDTAEVLVNCLLLEPCREAPADERDRL